VYNIRAAILAVKLTFICTTILAYIHVGILAVKLPYICAAILVVKLM
jgi:hypothetical protein